MAILEFVEDLAVVALVAASLLVDFRRELTRDFYREVTRFMG